ncbi:glycosyl hydrolase family 28-related protein (plasmid) [Methylocapsa polymorpha]|uniref:Glycosyl hydrolase family 28-related protein n=1 Tax=Methylocapsa polymorpha TaxID=3080828 RepID=A0ABZ0I0F9_9HYPH|nr:glycosyl hydrolase family 28-related protein [Methylocapsa sp. RX1]WOJ91636.1 glycosyl hydrolase family 28-related protein [Methylocapsa sp. RX1]
MSAIDRRPYEFTMPPYHRILKRIGPVGQAALFSILFSEASLAKPIIFNQPFTANPGDIVSIEGSGFGASPQLYFKPSRQASAAVLTPVQGANAIVQFRVPKTASFDQYEIWVSDGVTQSAHVFINAPRAMQFDTPEIAPGGSFRIFGRNLYVNGVAPKITFVDTQTGGSLGATFNTNGNYDAYRLAVIAPSGVVAGRTYQVIVSNGYGTATADQTILARASGVDHYGLGVPWALDFIYQNGPTYQAGVKGTNENDHHVYDVTTDPALTVHAKGDGVTDATAAIQQAIDLANSHGGGVVYLPAGTYRLASPNNGYLALRSGVVLQGHSNADTKITFGPTSPQGSSYKYTGIVWATDSQLSGIADLSLQNVDTKSQYVTNALPYGDNGGRIFLQRVNWNLGAGRSIFLLGNKIVIENSTFTQASNSQNLQPNGNSGLGPLYISPVSNLLFKNNTISWFSGQVLINDLTNGVIEGNHFTRNADQIMATAQQASWPYINKAIAVGDVIQRGEGRQLSINFGKNIVIHSNTFDTSGYPLKYNWNDGETILSEGGGPYRRGDTGLATAATALTISGNSSCSACSWNYYPNSIVSIVTGAGAGQIRNIVSRSNNTFTIDQPWDVVPSPGDHFAIDVPSFQNTLIRYNTMTGNPRGILLYEGSFLNVSVIGNSLIDNGGIWVRPDQRSIAIASGTIYKFDRVRNIEIIGNTLTNTKGLYGSYINVDHALIAPTSFWGTSTDGVEIRNNNLTARPGTPQYAIDEAYWNYTSYQNGNASYTDNGVNPIAGTILQGNGCTNCSTNYSASTGALNTIIWNAATMNSVGVSSMILNDFKIWSTAPHASTGTITGRD